MTKFRDRVEAQTLSAADIKALKRICARWDMYSAAVSQMNMLEVVKTLKYLMVKRPFSVTYGERAVQRYNSLNRVRWEDLKDGDRETSGSPLEEKD
jgi:phage terminase small subunit